MEDFTHSIRWRRTKRRSSASCGLGVNLTMCRKRPPTRSVAVAKPPSSSKRASRLTIPQPRAASSPTAAVSGSTSRCSTPTRRIPVPSSRLWREISRTRQSNCRRVSSRPSRDFRRPAHSRTPGSRQSGTAGRQGHPQFSRALPLPSRLSSDAVRAKTNSSSLR
jgi:hypothetical protein